MADLKQFKLPDVGEGLTEAEIVTWKVKPGDTLNVNDVIVEIETAKSLVELPSPFAGTVSELLVAEGDTVPVGSVIITVDVGAGATATAETGEAEPAVDAPSAAEQTTAAEPTADDSAPPDAGGRGAEVIATPKPDEPVEPGLIGGPAPGGRTSVLVGYGPRTTSAKRRPRKAGAVPEGASPAAAQAGVQRAFTPDAAPAPEVDPANTDTAPVTAAARTRPAPDDSATASVHVLAKPPVRKLAKNLGVDLGQVQATGPNGTVTRDDVESFAAGRADGFGATSTSPLPASMRDVFDGGDDVRIPIKGVRKMMAQAMVASAFTAPHVTEWLTLDVTRTTELVERLQGHRDFRDVKVSPLLVIARAVCLAMRRTPELNAYWDEPAQEIVLKRQVNLGIAVATSRGLVVPNIRGAEAMGLRELSTAMEALVSTARSGKTQPAEMSGGTFTITNVGVFGIDAGTPILNPGESGILAVGAISRRPWVVDEQVVPRDVTTLALSFDHRMVDGEQGSRFLADVASILEDPATALLF
jgi:2-oxoisovalerate dehydrogenase E2 component (dihydrolipoyl transacylase)